MKESYKSFDELPIMLSVSRVAKVLGISRTRSYELVNEKGFPKIKSAQELLYRKMNSSCGFKNKLRKDKNYVRKQKLQNRRQGLLHAEQNL